MKSFRVSVPFKCLCKLISSSFEFSSLVKLKLKAENRLKRKQHKQSFQDNQTINDEILTLDDISAAPSEQKGTSAS